MKFILVTLLLAGMLTAQIVFDTLPQTLQLYPRAFNDSASVIIAGRVTEAGHDSLVVSVTRAGLPASRIKVNLSYSDGSAPFRVAAAIRAETVEYGFRISLDEAPVASADSVVAGDVYIISGQSNAWTIGSQKPQYEFVRVPWVANIQAKTVLWNLGYEAGGGGGFWGGRLGYRITKNHGIPVCIVNWAVSGAGQSEFMRNNANPMDSNTYYGNMLMRTTFSGIKNHVKAFYWYQGEGNTGDDPVGYAAGFNVLYQAWHQDLPTIKKIYVWQINSWDGAFTAPLREAQRKFSNVYPDIQVMATLGTPFYNGHYEDTGYFCLGEQIYRVTAQDFYGIRKNRDFSSPDIQRAYFSSSLKDEITLIFSQPVVWPAPDGLGRRLEDFIYLDDSTGWVQSAAYDTARNAVILTLKGASTASNITYLPGLYNAGYSYFGPVLKGLAGTNTLTFHHFPIQSPSAGDTGTVQSLILFPADTAAALFGKLTLKAVVHYAGGALDTNNQVVFTSLDPAAGSVSPAGVVMPLGSGTLRIRAQKGGAADTATLHVGTAANAPLKISFKCKKSGLLTEDSASPELMGYFLTGTDDTVCYDLSAVAEYETDASLIRVESGRIFSLSKTGTTPLVASYMGLADTLSVTVYPIPSFVKRINFQPPNDIVTAVTGWSLETDGINGPDYSDAKGFGWTNGWAGYTHFPELNFLEATVNSPGSFDSMYFKIKAPDGNYTVKICNRGWQGRNMVKYKGDTLIYTPQTPQRFFTTKPITVTGGEGCVLNVWGGICYVVLISNDGAPMELVAYDDTVRPNTTTLPPLPTSSEKGIKIARTKLYGNQPNPFNPSTTLRYSLSSRTSASLRIYSVNGALIRSFRLNDVGGITRTILWDGKDENRCQVGCGVYMAELVTLGGERSRIKMILLK